jgi:hypothetical protein
MNYCTCKEALKIQESRRCQKCGNVIIWKDKPKSIYPWWRMWHTAKCRCYNGGHYKERYGTKFFLTEIDVHDLWMRDKAYDLKKPSIDRIDPKGDYTKDNCRIIEFRDNCKATQFKHKTTWGKGGHTKCIECNTTATAHHGLGLCHTCHARLRDRKIRADMLDA